MLALIVFVLLAVGSAGLALYAWTLERRRRVVLERVLGEGTPKASVAAALLTRPTQSERLGARIERWVPQPWRADERVRERLLRAGFEEAHAATIFAGARVTLLALLPTLAVMLSWSESFDMAVLYVVGAIVSAWVIPAGVVDGMVRRRQERLRRAIPDALDLLLVCVEAGSSLELAIQRVSRELRVLHPELADELASVVRRIKAGMPRSDALKALYGRTGVDELRTIATNVIQSERWGTSISKVLRVTADTLRKKRRQQAERRAQTAPVKMTMPLIILILPALFVVLLGPTMISIMQTMR